jgi:hypothetical protein
VEQSGGSVPEASVTVTNTTTGIATGATTNSRGQLQVEDVLRADKLEPELRQPEPTVVALEDVIGASVPGLGRHVRRRQTAMLCAAADGLRGLRGLSIQVGQQMKVSVGVARI